MIRISRISNKIDNAIIIAAPAISPRNIMARTFRKVFIGRDGLFTEP